jgi:ABC-type transport system involved in cytochrome bd biosynthesis fused ATPase/permease subunit
MKGKTTINVTHKLDRVKEKQNIFVVKAGKVIEEGSYQNLI